MGFKELWLLYLCISFIYLIVKHLLEKRSKQ